MYITYLINGLNGGGAAFPVPDLVRLMESRGHRVKVIALMPQDMKSAARFDAAGLDWTLIGTGPRDFVGCARKLLALLRTEKPDLIWTSLTRATLFGQVAGRLCGIPVVSWQHNAFLKPGNRRLLKLTRPLSAFWVTDSETVADFATDILGIQRPLINVWPLFRARDDVPQAQACPANQRFRIGSLGRLHPNKNFCDLIAAAAELRRQRPELAARLVIEIGGTGPEQAALQAQIDAERLDNVKLIGFVERPADYLATLHGYVQPSHHEGLCIAAHEAMQAGLAVIATRVGELQRSVVPAETGALCAVGDVAAITAAMIALVEDPPRAARMGAASRARVLQRFGIAAFEAAGAEALARAEKLVAARKPR